MLISTAFALESGSPVIGLANTIAPMVAIFIIFYILLIHPQQKKHKEHQKDINELKKGSKIILGSGVVGSISDMSDKEGLFTVQIADKVNVKVVRDGIAKVVKKEEPKPIKKTIDNPKKVASQKKKNTVNDNKKKITAKPVATISKPTQQKPVAKKPVAKKTTTKKPTNKKTK